MVGNLNSYLVLPRQNYKTVSAACFYLWAYAFGTRNSHILFFNKSLADSVNNLKRLKNLLELLPEWLRDGVLVDPEGDLNNVVYVQSGHRNNRIDAKAPGRDPDHADNLGRGVTVPMAWWDEISFMKYVEITYTAAAPASSQAKLAAAQNGSPYGTCITTTPNFISVDCGEFAFRIRSGSLPFRFQFYDLGPTRVRELMDTQAEYPFIYIEYSYREIGRSEKWFRTQCKELLNDRVKIKREILLDWPMSGEGSIFDEDELDELKRHECQTASVLPIKVRRGNAPTGLELVFAEVPDPTLPYIIGFDTASGEGLDYTAAVISHPHDMRQVGYLRTNTADDEAVKAIAEHILVDLFSNSIAVVERNYLGLVLVNHLIRDARIEPRVFYLEKVKSTERTVGKGGRALVLKRKTRVYGVDTTAESREAMMRHLFQIVQELPQLIRLSVVQNEIKTLHRKRSGKIEHRPGFHDDTLMAWLMTVYADRHEQPVLRSMLAKQVGGKAALAVARVGALNLPQDAGSPEVAAAVAAGESRDLTLDEYLARDANRDKDEAAQKRRQLADAIAALNGGDLPV